MFSSSFVFQSLISVLEDMVILILRDTRLRGMLGVSWC